MRNNNRPILIALLIFIILTFLLSVGFSNISVYGEALQKLPLVYRKDDDESTKTPEKTPPIPQVEPSPSETPRPTLTAPIPQIEPDSTPQRSPALTPAPTPSPYMTRKPELSPDEARARKRNREILKKRIGNLVRNEPAWKTSKVGICVAVLDTRDVVYSKNGNLPMIPASNLKILTTAAAIAQLGPGFKFETSVWGEPADKLTGVMEGNLYLRGTGDPTFMTPFTKDPMAVFRKAVQDLKKKGIRMINGDLVGDDSAFDREFLGRGWKPRYLLDDYAAPAGALSINANYIDVGIRNGKVIMYPDNGHMNVSRKKSKSGRTYIIRKLGTDNVYIYGYKGGRVGRGLTVNNPSKLTTSAFGRLLKKNGIKITGKVRLIRNDEKDYTSNRVKLFSHHSVPLYKIVRETNKESDNVCAQHLFKAIGYYVKGKGTCNNSNEAVREFLEEAGVNASGLIMADGSGLSEYSRVTPVQFCQLLAYMYKHPQKKPFFKSLPVAGKDGTLAYRMRGLPVYAKTGSLKGHIALSGYVRTNAGQMLVFSIMTNYHRYSSGRIRYNEDQLVKIIASFGGKL
ncbi:MAG: D-alanyl-D-alanine carboxypeptidase/D-alanyl-D-alanine-endopeptidase [Candidatus Eremiobacteraeota bacterium]|nr:D-alanyl-D-alanine carboxypeptidase/D-alanyl-D-alanine-endopeptidase [Candidatus Eremiobacteraeota bacterium]